MREGLLKDATRIKLLGYNTINNCRNAKVRLDGIRVIENVERVGLRGVFLEFNDDKAELLTGLTTTKKILTGAVIPIINQFNLSNDLNSVQDTLINLDYIKNNSKYRMNLTEMLREVYRNGSEVLIKKDKYGEIKSTSFKAEILYIQGSLMERKLIAYNNKIKKIS